MHQLYTDASFDYKHTDQTTETFVRGKIAVVADGIKIVEKVKIGKVPVLKQYINILELIAIGRAVEIAVQREWEGDLLVTTDSQVAKSWAKNGRVNPAVCTIAHQNALEYLKKSCVGYRGVITFAQAPREVNPAGHLLAEELKKEPPHTI